MSTSLPAGIRDRRASGPAFVFLMLIGGCRASVPVSAATGRASGLQELAPDRLPVAGRSGTRASRPTVDPIAALAQGALLLEDLGPLHRDVTTRSPEAQRYFNQGLRLIYAFNHDEAARSFAKAAELDPACTSCYWGVAYALGPNYNVPMLPHHAAPAWQALQRAQATAQNARPVEQALIAALAKRYPGPAVLAPEQMQAHAQAYANAMRELAASYRADDDVQVLFAESLMDVRPWNLYTSAGEPTADTLEIVATLEQVLAHNSRHPGANHYYIHAVEASRYPERALPAAERLAGLMPGAGHLVHMPAHIYQRIGRYDDAVAANQAAIAADLRYLRRAQPTGYYPMYLAHNYGFLSYAASMLGHNAQASQAAASSAQAMPAQMLAMMPGMEYFSAAPYFVNVRFGNWRDALSLPPPSQRYPVLRALWHHGRGMAFIATGKLAEGKQELIAITKLLVGLPAEARAGNNSARQVVELARRTVAARLAERQGAKDAVDLWRQAVALEDELNYAEPADWFYPLRHYLGAALLDAHQPVEAEAVYRADLKKHPNNGWALFGLMQALDAQGKSQEAKRVQQQFASAWKTADIKLERSAF